jgi:hypothetical protein
MQRDTGGRLFRRAPSPEPVAFGMLRNSGAAKHGAKTVASGVLRNGRAAQTPNRNHRAAKRRAETSSRNVEPKRRAETSSRNVEPPNAVPKRRTGQTPLRNGGAAKHRADASETAPFIGAEWPSPQGQKLATSTGVELSMPAPLPSSPRAPEPQHWMRLAVRRAQV